VFGGARRRFAPASANRRGAEREDISGGYNYQTCITGKKVFCCTGLDDPAQASFCNDYAIKAVQQARESGKSFKG
jgi:hypothetical protein